MFNNSSAFNDDLDSTMSSCYNLNQLNRFPILPLSSNMPTIGGAAYSFDELNEGFAPHPMPVRRLSSSSTSSSSSEMSLPPSSFQAMPHNLDIELSPSPSPIDGMPINIPSSSSMLPDTPLNSPTQAQATIDASGKKTRAAPRERVSLKDFRPPDVTGLSKREARLVKNRAAAFLSRQRKREEFEQMEVRVGELEKENLRLRGHLSLTGRDASFTEAAFHAEMTAMRAQLASSEQRAAELRNELLRVRTVQPAFNPLVKQESLDFGFGRSPSPSSSDDCSSGDRDRTATKLGLMVLMALSSVLSKSSGAQWGLPTKFSVSTDSTSDNAFGDNVFTDPQRRAWNTFTGDALASATDAEFDVSFTPSMDGKTQVKLSVPSRQDPFAMSWPSANPSEFAFDMPMGMQDMSFDAFSSDEGLKRRLRVTMKNPSSGGDWDIEVL
ncbi:hypothetical protein EXIGLDRAFT_690875 [Exidia glandulosa HHB12029]|uniref:BZIP domain-containing protein n=1 Tax=Exidia glandulosa HHB12029 TaxID=1314781 RepID=A0A165QZV9_EXIGL|nr:hypothetical protein EXIGLDRAFT_690875 [Exidia glandulosa HHB12029]